MYRMLDVVDDDVIGAIGISGASADDDEYSAMWGVLRTNDQLKIKPTADLCTTKKH